MGVTPTILRERAEAKIVNEGGDTNPLNLMRRRALSAATFFQKSGRDTEIDMRALSDARRDAGQNPAVQGSDIAFGNSTSQLNELIAVMKANTDAQMKANALGAGAVRQAPQQVNLGPARAGPLRP